VALDQLERHVDVAAAGQVPGGAHERVAVEDVEDAGDGNEDVVLGDRRLDGAVDLVAADAGTALVAVAPTVAATTATAAVLVVEAVLVLAALGTGVLLALRLTGPGVGGCRLVAAVLGLRVAGLGAVLACGARAGATGTALPRAWPSACSAASDRTSRSASARAGAVSTGACAACSGATTGVACSVAGAVSTPRPVLVARRERRGSVPRVGSLARADGSLVAAGPLSPFWRALMAATRSPLRILAVPLMPMLEASPWSSANRMAVSAPERRGLAPAVDGSRVVVSDTKDPFPRSWMASMRPISGGSRRGRSAG
jgi:hypothetical protein